jgi:hypothetical protein
LDFLAAAAIALGDALLKEIPFKFELEFRPRPMRSDPSRGYSVRNSI